MPVKPLIHPRGHRRPLGRASVNLGGIHVHPDEASPTRHARGRGAAVGRDERDRVIMPESAKSLDTSRAADVLRPRGEVDAGVEVAMDVVAVGTRAIFLLEERVLEGVGDGGLAGAGGP